MKKSKIISINGEAWCRPLTGIERVTIEVVKNLDKLVSPDRIELVVPKNAKSLPELKNIKIITLDAEANFFPKWTQVHYQKYILKNHRISFDFSNTCPYFAPEITFLHDIYCKLYKDDMSGSRRDKLIRLYSNLMYRRIAKKSKLIFTTSEYTKKTIIDTYKLKDKKAERVKVVYSGISDYNSIVPDKSIFDALPDLQKTDFYFTLGSLSVRKNLKWIARHAELFPNETFVISGKPLPAVVAPELENLRTLKNVIFTGYLSDEQVKALMQKCKAFIFPSYFEGFGIPPLEALSGGAKVIISNATCLPELYGNCAYYINPDEPNVNLDKLLEKEVDSPYTILEKFTLKNTTERIYEEIKSFL